MIPNLNEIMAEFIDIDEEKTLEPMMTFNEEEVQEKSVEAEVQVKKGRKRKRNNEEENGQSSGDGVEDFVSDEAYEVMNKKVLKKGFIEETGFTHFISPFK